MESDKTMLWSMMGLLSLQKNAVPSYLHQLYKLWKSFRDNSSAFSHLEIPEYDGPLMGTSNEIYRSVRTYLSSLEATANAPGVSISRPSRSSKLGFSLPCQYAVKDEYRGVQMWWSHVVKEDEKQGGRVIGSATRDRRYVLKIPNKDKPRVLSAYIDHISEFAENVKRKSRDRKLYSNTKSHGGWSSVPFKHPSTFETLALDPHLKDMVQKDLLSFQNSRDFYRKTGRAWKRGYLLYGPPGTGKSSLIAAIANYMNYDVYDLELTRVLRNSTLRKLLLATSSKSVVVIEDIDCATNLSRRSKKPKRSHKDGSKVCGTAYSTITLSGLLNFADGLWSSCGEEKIMIFTTNHKEKLDPALLRSGRMDLHIHLSYCGFAAFKQLVSNYLDVENHKLFESVEEKMKSGGRVTPAEICEILIQNQTDPHSAIMGVVHSLEDSIKRSEEEVSVSTESQSSEEEVAVSTESQSSEEEESSSSSSTLSDVESE